jgi:hypothetical protein
MDLSSALILTSIDTGMQRSPTAANNCGDDNRKLARIARNAGRVGNRLFLIVSGIERL